MFVIVTMDNVGVDTFITNTIENAIIKSLEYLDSVFIFIDQKQIEKCYEQLKSELTVCYNSGKFKIDTRSVEVMIFEIAEVYESETTIDNIKNKMIQNSLEQKELQIEELKSQIQSFQSQISSLQDKIESLELEISI